MRSEKEEKSFAKDGFELRSIVSKCTRLTIYATETDVKWVSFFSVGYPNHTLEGGVSVKAFTNKAAICTCVIDTPLN